MPLTPEELSEARDLPNVAAFLRVIREGESSQDDDAYTVMFGGGHFVSFADHPRIVHGVRVRGRILKSSAAGAYQFLRKTWDGLVRIYGFDDFSPRSQDLAAVALLDEDGSLADLREGHVIAAIDKSNGTWASLPDSPYGQPTQDLAHALAVYAEYGGTVDGARTRRRPNPRKRKKRS